MNKMRKIICLVLMIIVLFDLKVTAAGFVWPVDFKYFYLNDGLKYRGSAMHIGTDFSITGGSSNTPYKFYNCAIGDGVVEISGSSNSAGQWVVLNHELEQGGTIKSVYMHMENGSRLVKVGDKVKAGAKLGVTGNTGDSDGAHLHLDIKTTVSKFGSGKFQNIDGYELPKAKTYHMLVSGSNKAYASELIIKHNYLGGFVEIDASEAVDTDAVATSLGLVGGKYMDYRPSPNTGTMAPGGTVSGNTPGTSTQGALTTNPNAPKDIDKELSISQDVIAYGAVEDFGDALIKIRDLIYTYAKSFLALLVFIIIVSIGFAIIIKRKDSKGRAVELQALSGVVIGIVIVVCLLAILKILGVIS